MKRTSPSRPGFTLIELLVVVGIIAVLVGVIFPTIKGVRQSAIRAQCASNMRQIYMGALKYAERYDGFLPGQVQWAMHDSLSPSDPWITWAPAMHAEMFKFIDGRLYMCPGDVAVSTYAPDSDQGEDWRMKPPYMPGGGHNQTSYFMFMGTAVHPWSVGQAGSPDDPITRFPPLLYQTYKRGCIFDTTLFGNNPIHIAKLTDVSSPRQILLMDRYYSRLQKGGYLESGYTPGTIAAARLVSNHPSKDIFNQAGVEFVIAKGVNALLADGSVKWMDTQHESQSSVVANPRFGGKMMYHYDYYHQHIYADSEHHWKNWKQK
jgi:prepilin-type N-terminal cleavage/methylation domain-containing protein